MRTHKRLAEALDVSINAVAIVREILAGTSNDAQRALALCEGDLAEAARRLAGRRMCDGKTSRSITWDLVEAIMREDGLSKNGLQQVPLVRIVPSRWQPREPVFDEDRLWELARSIQEQGLINPVVVFDAGDGTFELVAGERRTRAVLGLAWATVDDVSPKTAVQRLAQGGLGALPDEARDLLTSAGAGIAARVEVAEDVEDLERLHRMAVVENIERESLTALEEGRAFQSLMETYGWSQREMARRIGKSQGYVAQRVGLLDLPDAAQAAVNTRVITTTHARAIAQVPEALQPVVTDWVTRAVSKEHSPATTRQVQALTRQVANFLDLSRWWPVPGMVLEPTWRNRLALMRWLLHRMDWDKWGRRLIGLRDCGYEGNLLDRSPMDIVQGHYGTVLEKLGYSRAIELWRTFAQETGRMCEDCVLGPYDVVGYTGLRPYCLRWWDGRSEQRTTCEGFIGQMDPVVISLSHDQAHQFKELDIEVIYEPFPHVQSAADYVKGYGQAAKLEERWIEERTQAKDRAHLDTIQAYSEWQLEQPDTVLRHFQAHACHKCVNYRPELVEETLPPCQLAVEPLTKPWSDSAYRAPKYGVLVAQDGRLLPRCERFQYKTLPTLVSAEGVCFGDETQRRAVLRWFRMVLSVPCPYDKDVLFDRLGWLPADRSAKGSWDLDRLVKWIGLAWEALGGDGAVATLFDLAINEVQAKRSRGSKLTLLNPVTGEMETWAGLDLRLLIGETANQWSVRKWPEGWPRPWEESK